MNKLELKKSWQWLLYLYLVLPLLIFGAAFLLKNTSFGVSLARIFHSYNLYIINPIPDLASLTGIVGVVLPLVFILPTLRKKDYGDLLICLGLVAAVAVYFYFEWNYLAVPLLRFA